MDLKLIGSIDLIGVGSPVPLCHRKEVKLRISQKIVRKFPFRKIGVAKSSVILLRKTFPRQHKILFIVVLSVLNLLEEEENAIR